MGPTTVAQTGMVDALVRYVIVSESLANNEDRRLYFESIGAADEPGTFKLVAMGWDADHYYFLAAQ